MKKTTKKLALHKDLVRNLAGVELAIAHGGMINPTRTNCEPQGPCAPPPSEVACSTRVLACR